MICTVIDRCTETFWSPCILRLVNVLLPSYLPAGSISKHLTSALHYQLREYDPSCIAVRHSGTRFPSFRGTQLFFNGSHQHSTGPSPKQINPVYTSHPHFVRFFSILLIYPPIYTMVIKMFCLISNTMLTNCAKPFRLHGFTSLLRGAQFPIASSPWQQFFFFFLFSVASYIGGSSVWKFLSCRPSGAWNFGVAYEFFGTFVHPWAVTISYLSLYLLCPLY
jgi:hypothetical protein